MTPFTIFLANSKTLYLKAINVSACESDPLDLTSCTEIDIALPKQDGTFLHLKLSDDEVAITAPALLGKFSAPISAEDSVDLNVGEFQDFDVTFTIASRVFTVRYPRLLSVFEIR